MHPLIGITTYGQDDAGSYTLPAEYVASVRRAGGIPVLIPPGEENLAELCDRLNAFILAGGGDIDPALYHGQPHKSVYMVNSDRDQMEMALARELIRRDIPTLAICRGMQILNIALGGTLHEHIPDTFGEQLNHRLPPRNPTPHEVVVERESYLAAVVGKEKLTGASWHHQAVKHVGEGLRVAATADDGVIEALEIPDHHWFLAVQWHPELTSADNPRQQQLFNALVEQAKLTIQ